MESAHDKLRGCVWFSYKYCRHLFSAFTLVLWSSLLLAKIIILQICQFVGLCVCLFVNFGKYVRLTVCPSACLSVFLSVCGAIHVAVFDHSSTKVVWCHTRPRSVAAGNRHSHATLGIMGNHRKVVLYHNNVDFTATRGQRVKATTV